MKDDPMPFRFPPLLATACLLAQISAAPAQEATSQSDEDACRPDVFRLCASEIPDEGAIVSCLNAKLEGLSPACHAVMAPTSSIKKRRAPREAHAKRAAEG